MLPPHDDSDNDLRRKMESYEPEFDPAAWVNMQARLSRANRTLAYHFRYDWAAVLGLFLLLGGVYVKWYQSRQTFFSANHAALIPPIGLQGTSLFGYDFDKCTIAHQPKISEHPIPISKPTQTKTSITTPSKPATFLSPVPEMKPDFSSKIQPVRLLSFHASQIETSAEKPESEKLSISLGGSVYTDGLQANQPWVGYGFDGRISLKIKGRLHALTGFQWGNFNSRGVLSATRTIERYAVPVLFTPNRSDDFPLTALTNIPYHVQSTFLLINVPLGLGYDLQFHRQLQTRIVALCNNVFISHEVHKFQLMDNQQIPSQFRDKHIEQFEEYYGHDTRMNFISGFTIGVLMRKRIFKRFEMGIEPFVQIPLTSTGTYRTRIHTMGLSLRVGWAGRI